MADTLLTPPFVRGHDHAVGDAGPALVLFGDYTDPDSAAAHQGVLALRERWDGFTYAWRHLPLTTVANGAALFAEGAAAQDAFWAYHHILLARQDSLSVPDLMSYAGQIGLDLAMLIDGIEQERDVQRILDDIGSAKRSGTLTTPTLFIESVRWEGGWEPDALEGALRAALAG
jgi:protein-disulfide isomerase